MQRWAWLPSGPSPCNKLVQYTTLALCRCLMAELCGRGYLSITVRWLSGIFARRREPLFLHVITKSSFRPERRFDRRGVEKPAFLHTLAIDQALYSNTGFSTSASPSVEMTISWGVHYTNIYCSDAESTTQQQI